MEKSQRLYSLYISFTVAAVFFTNYSFVLEPFLGVPYMYVSVGSKILLILFFLYLVPRMIKIMKVKCIMCTVFLSMFFLLNYVFFPDLNEYQNETAVYFIGMCLPVFIVSFHIDDYKLLLDILVKTSWVISFFLLILLLLYFFNLINPHVVSAYYMGFGYSCLLPASINVIDCYLHRRIRSAFMFILCLLCMLLLGSRGPLFGVFMMIVLMFANEFKQHYIEGRGMTFYKLLCVFFVMISFLATLYVVDVSPFSQVELESRTLKLLFSGELGSHTSGRDVIFEKLWEELSNNVIAIRGINAEYPLIGLYAHNIYWELLFQFGVILGGGMLIILLHGILLSINQGMKNERGVTINLFMLVSLSQLMFSSSLWQSPNFWIWVALSISLIGNKKRLILTKG